MTFNDFKKQFSSDDEWKEKFTSIPEENLPTYFEDCDYELTMEWKLIYMQVKHKYIYSDNNYIMDYCKQPDVFLDNISFEDYREVTIYSLFYKVYYYKEQDALREVEFQEEYLKELYENKESPFGAAVLIGYACG